MLDLRALVRRLSPTHLTLGSLLSIASVLGLMPVPSIGAGVVTNCTSFGPGPGTLGTALNGGGWVTFSCSGSIIIPEFGINIDTVVDATGQTMTLSDNHSNAMFYVQNARLDLVNLNLTGGASDNGGIVARNATVTLTHAMLIGNSARYGGGGIGAFSSNVTLVDSTVSGNSAGPGAGLGLFENSSGTLVRSTVSGNSAFSGGGIEVRASQLTLIESTVSGNSSTSHGGGLQVDNASAVLISTTVSENSATAGGGIAADTRTVALTVAAA